MVAVLPVLAIQIAFAIGLGMVLGVLNVFFRDVGQLFGVVLQFWFWLTPIIYPASILPERLQPLMALNPMASVMTAYQTIIVRGEWPDWGSRWLVPTIDLLLCIWGMSLFRKDRKGVVKGKR